MDTARRWGRDEGCVGRWLWATTVQWARMQCIHLGLGFCVLNLQLPKASRKSAKGLELPWRYWRLFLPAEKGPVGLALLWVRSAEPQKC